MCHHHEYEHVADWEHLRERIEDEEPGAETVADDEGEPEHAREEPAPVTPPADD